MAAITVPSTPALAERRRGLLTLGGVALMLSAALFLLRGLLDFVVGPPPANGAAILAWVETGRLLLQLANELHFFAAVCLIPAVVALHHSLARTSPLKAMVGCGLVALVIPVLAMLVIVHGRLVYPIYGVVIRTPELAELAVALFYGGLHATNIIFGAATIILSLAMRRSGFGPRIALLGFAAGVCDFVGAYPDAIGSVALLGCQIVFAAWFVVVGAKLLRLP